MHPQQRTGLRQDGLKVRPKTITLKPKRWSHQNDLDAAIGKKIVLMRAPMPNIEGELVAADQFTIKVKIKNAMPDPSFVVVFKSALTSFEVKE